MTTKARQFTDGDWQAFSGATEWNPNRQPLIRELENCTAIGDSTTVELCFSGDEDEIWDLSICHDFAEYVPFSLAELILNGLPKDLDTKKAQELGFVRIN